MNIQFLRQTANERRHGAGGRCCSASHLSDPAHHLALNHHRLVVLGVERGLLRRLHQVVRGSLDGVARDLRNTRTKTHTEIEYI